MTEINFGPSRELFNHDQTAGRKLTLKLCPESDECRIPCIVRLEQRAEGLAFQITGVLVTWSSHRSALHITSVHFTAAAVGHQYYVQFTVN